MVAKDHGTLSLTLLYSLAGVEGFEPPHDGTRTRCLTTWRHPIAVDTVAQAEVVFKLFAPEPIGFIVLPTNLLSCRSFEEMVACHQANKFSSFACEMNNSIETFLLSLHEREV